MNLSIIIMFDFICLLFWNSFDSQLRKEDEATAQLQVAISARTICEHFAYLVCYLNKKINGGNL